MADRGFWPRTWQTNGTSSCWWPVVIGVWYEGQYLLWFLWFGCLARFNIFMPLARQCETGLEGIAEKSPIRAILNAYCRLSVVLAFLGCLAIIAVERKEVGD